jgi:hypothetical protein
MTTESTVVTPAQNNTQAAATTTENVTQQSTLLGSEPQANAPANAQATGTTPPAQAAATDKGQSKTQVGAPETYTSFTLPEGVVIEPAMLSKITAEMKAANLTQEQAQKFIDLSTENSKSIIETQAREWKSIRETWVGEIKNDKEYGGQKFGETIERANRALNKFGTPELKTFLANSGYGDSPELIKLLAKVDKAVGEDKSVDGNTSAHAGKTAAQVIYGS